MGVLVGGGAIVAVGVGRRQAAAGQRHGRAAHQAKRIDLDRTGRTARDLLHQRMQLEQTEVVGAGRP